VEVYGGAAGDDDLVGLRPDQRRHNGAEPLAVVDPRDLPPAPAAYAKAPPLARDPHQRLLGVPAHQAEAVTVHVDAAGDMVEAILEDGEGVLGVEPQRIVLTQLETHAGILALRISWLS